MLTRIRAAVVFAVVVSLLVATPGLDCWAEVGKVVGPENAGAAAARVAPLPPVALGDLNPALTPSAAMGETSLPAAIAAAVPAQAASQDMRLPIASQAQRPITEREAASAGRPYDGTSDSAADGATAVAAPFAGLSAHAQVDALDSLSGPSADLKLSDADAEAVADFTAAFHQWVIQKYKGGEYEFTDRDYYAWLRYLRFFTPRYGIKEALHRGALYVYGDRLEKDTELTDLKNELQVKLGGLALSNPKHGKDDAKAAELLKLAEPGPAQLQPDEDSPFQIPLADLVPDKAKVDLVMTAKTLDRVQAAYDAFAQRDFALLLGPPATEKSAIPKYLAAEFKIPYLAVSMHPGIGTFELVGGYRPKVVEIKRLSDAVRIVKARLAAAREGGDYSEIVESAGKVYGGKPLRDVLASIEQDINYQTPAQDQLGKDAYLNDVEVKRRLNTLAHGLEYGASSLVWQDGYLLYAIKRDIWISFEEINAAPTESQEFLNEFMRSRRLVVTQKLGEPQVYSPRKNGRFMLWATMNPETDSNREVLAQTLKNRWRIKYFGDLPDLEQAEIIEKKFHLPGVWATALVVVHKQLRSQAVGRVIGDQWDDGYEINLRHLLKIARRWRYFVDQETEENGAAPSQNRQLYLLGREAYAVWGGMMRLSNERSGVFTLLDQALHLSRAGYGTEDGLRVKPERIEDLGDSIRIGDVVLPKGQGGPFVPKPSADYLVDATVLERLYADAKALALGEPLLLMGESGAGKTSDLEYLFFRLNKNMRYKNLDSDTVIEEVIGGYAPGKRRGQFVFGEGLVPYAMEEGSGAFLDEFNLNPLVEWLNTVIDDGRLYLPHRIVEGHAMIVAAANPPEPRYPGRILLSAATRSRYTELWVDKDGSKARLQRLMRHWLKGGTIYGIALPLFIGAMSLLHHFGQATTLPAFNAMPRKTGPPVVRGITLIPGQSLGEYTPKSIWGGFLSWLIPGGALTAAAFFLIKYFWAPDELFPVALFTAMFGGLFLAMGIVHGVDPVVARNEKKPLAAANVAAIRQSVLQGVMLPEAEKWADSLTAGNRSTRLGTIKALSARGRETAYLEPLARLALAETTSENFAAAVGAIGKIGGLEAELALRELRDLAPRHGPVIEAALRQAAEVSTAAQPMTVAEAARIGASDELRDAAAALLDRASAVLGSGRDSRTFSFPMALRMTAIERSRDALAAAMADPNPSEVVRAMDGLKSLLDPIHAIQFLPAFNAMPNPFAGLSARLPGWLQRALKLKKKDPEPDLDSNQELALPPTLDEMLKEKGIPEAEWPAYRAKADKVQTLMTMVGSAVSQDVELKWMPGPAWAKFLNFKIAIYPVEHLITHSEEQIIGLIDHESEHHEITVTDDRYPLVRKFLENPFYLVLFNAFEDPRVNNRAIHRLPGARRYLNAVYDRYIPENLDFSKPAASGKDQENAPEGDGPGALIKNMDQPHMEYMMAVQYYWRYGHKPPRFVNRSVEKLFDDPRHVAAMKEIFQAFPPGSDPAKDEKLAYTLKTFELLDKNILPAYETLVKESEQKLAQRMKKGGKSGKNGKNDKNGKGRNQSSQEGQGQTPQMPSPSLPSPGQSPQQQKQKNQEKDDAGGDEEPPKQDKSKEAAQARRQMQNDAREAAQQLGDKIQDNPTRSKSDSKAKDKKKDQSQASQAGHQKPGDADAAPLTIEEIAQAQRDMILNQEISPYQRAYQPVANLSNPMVTHLNNVFQKNARPRDIGYFKRGKRPEVKRYMKLQGEGGVREDYMLRRTQKTKRRYKVTILVDASLSVEAFRREIIQTVVLLTDSLSRLRIDTEVILFSNTAHFSKEFRKPMTPQAKDKLVAEMQTLLAHLGSGATHDADALKLAVDRIKLQDAEKRFVFVVTDGRGNGPSSIASVFPEADAAGVRVVGVGVGEGMAYVKEVYPHHAVVEDIKDLPLTLKKVLEEYIGRQERAADKSRQGKLLKFLAAFNAAPSQPSARLPWLAIGLRAGIAAGMTLMTWAIFMAYGAIYTSTLWCALAIIAGAGLSVLISQKIGQGIGTPVLFAVVFGAMLGKMPAPWIFLPIGLISTVNSWWLAYHLMPPGLRLAAKLAAALPGVSAFTGDPAALKRLRAWDRDLRLWRGRQLRALLEMSGDPKSAFFIRALALIARENPRNEFDETHAVRLAAIDVLGPLAPDHGEARRALEDILQGDGLSQGKELHDRAKRWLDEADAQAVSSLKVDDLAGKSLKTSLESQPYQALLARARGFMSSTRSMDRVTQIRALAIERESQNLSAAIFAKNWETAAQAAQRLHNQLDAAPSAMSFLPALHAQPSQPLLDRFPWIIRWLHRPRLAAALAMLAFNGVVFGLLLAFGPLPVAFARLLCAAALVAAVPAVLRRGLGWKVAFGALLTIGFAHISLTNPVFNHGWIDGFFLLSLLDGWALALSNPRKSLGLPYRNVSDALKDWEAQAALTPQAHTWLRDLSGINDERNRAFDQMRADLALARPLLPALVILTQQNDPIVGENVVGFLEAWRDEESINALRSLAAGSDPATIRYAQQALARLRDADKGGRMLHRLSDRQAGTYDPLLERARSALVSMPANSKIERLRQQALEAGIAQLQSALLEGPDPAAIAARRLEDQLDGAAAAVNFLPAFNAQPNALPIHKPGWFSFYHLNVIAGLAVYVAALVFFPHVLSTLLSLAILALMFGYSLKLRDGTPWPAILGIGSFISMSAMFAGMELISPLIPGAIGMFVGAGALMAVITKKWRPLSWRTSWSLLRQRLAMSRDHAAIDNPAMAPHIAKYRQWALRLDSRNIVRRQTIGAIEAAASFDSATPALVDPIIPMIGTLAVQDPDGDADGSAAVQAVQALRALGARPLAKQWLRMAADSAPAPYTRYQASQALHAIWVQETAQAAPSEELLKLANAAARPDFAREAKALIQAARALQARLAGSGLMGRLRSAAIEDAIVSLEAAVANGSPDAAATASRQLSQHVSEAPQAMNYLPAFNLLPSRGAVDSESAAAAPVPARNPVWLPAKIRLLALGAFASSAAALAIGVGVPLVALWWLWPPAGVVAGLAAGLFLYKASRSLREMKAPTYWDNDPRVQVAVRGTGASLPEWRPMEDALNGLLAQLGISAENGPSLGYWKLDANNAGSIGRSLDGESVVALGERWISAPPMVLRAVLAHEMGHLRFRDHVVFEIWRRVQTFGYWSLIPLLAASALLFAVVGAGGLWPLVAVPLLGLSRLLRAAQSRQVELRADLFAASLEPQGMPGFLNSLNYALRWWHYFSGGHPPVATRLKNLNRHGGY